MADQLLMISFIVIGVFYIIMMIVSIPANLLIITATIFDKKLRSPINMLACNLSLAALLIAVFRIPVKSYELFHPHADFLFSRSLLMCVLQQLVPASCILCISITLTTICVYRFLIMNYPMKPQLKMTRARLYIFLPSSWIVSFACFIAYVSYLRLLTTNNQLQCMPVYPNSPNDIRIQQRVGNTTSYRSIETTKIVIWTLFISLTFLIPSIIMSVLSSHLVRQLWSGINRTHQSYTLTQRNEIKRLKQKQRTVKILIVCCSVFMIINLPYYVLFMLIDMEIVIIPNARIVINTLIMVNYSTIAYNPIIYGYFNHGFRHRIHAIIRRITDCRRR